MKAAALKLEPDDAAALLDLLAPGEPVTFQTFDEGTSKGRRELTRTLHGTLTQHRATLTDLNRRGAGVFWTVNATDGKGRKASDVVRVRALFVDLDGAPLEPVQSAPLTPHCVVESSPARWHAYWRIADCPPADFKGLQKALAERFQGDGSVCDLPRVMRLPGFQHRKVQPFTSRIVELRNALPYTMDNICTAFGVYTETQEAQIHRYTGNTETQVRRESITPELARFVPATEGQRNRCLFQLARHVKARMPNATKEDLRGFIKQWHALALPNIATNDFAESWGDFMRGWEHVRFPEGAALDALLEGVERDHLPQGIPDDYGSSALHLVRICARLQKHAGKDAFYLSARTAGDRLGTSHARAACLLNALVVDGILERVSVGTQANRKASEYRVRAPFIDNGECYEATGYQFRKTKSAPGWSAR